MSNGEEQRTGVSGLYGPETDAPVSLAVYTRAVWRRKWLAAGLALLVAGAGVLFTRLEKPVYEATAFLVFIDRPSGAFRAEPAERVTADLVDSQIPLIERPESLAQIVNDPELAILGSEMFRGKADPAKALDKRLKLMRLENTDILSITMAGENPKLITAIVNKIASNRRAHFEQDRDASTAAAIEEYTRKMADTESEQDKLDYRIWKRANDAAIPSMIFREQQKDGQVIMKMFEQRRDQLQAQCMATTQQLDQGAAELAAKELQFLRLCDSTIKTAVAPPATTQVAAANAPKPAAAGNSEGEPAHSPKVAATGSALPAEKPPKAEVVAVTAARVAEIYKALAAAEAEAAAALSGAPMSAAATAKTEARRHELHAQLDQAMNAIFVQDQAVQRSVADRTAAEQKLANLMLRIDALDESIAVRRQQLTPEALETDPILQPLENRRAALDEQYQKERARLDSESVSLAYAAGETQKVHNLEEAYAAVAVSRQFQSTARERLSAVRTELEAVNAVLSDSSTDAAKAVRLSEAYAKMEQWVREVKFALNQIAVTVYDAAEPEAPIRPRWPINIAFSVLLGLMLGGGTTILLEMGGSTVKTPEDVSRRLAARTLGVVPHLDGLDAGHRVLSLKDCDDPHIDEAFNEIRFAIQSLGEGSGRSFVITSATVGEGKSTVATMLAVSFARAGEKVLLVDGNLRAPYLHAVFHAPPKPGLAAVISNGQLGRATLQSTPVPNLLLLPAGATDAEALAALQPRRIAEFVRNAQAQFDRIIFDATSTIGVTDVRAIARGIGGVIYVVHAGRHNRTVVIRGLQTLRGIQAKVLGVVLNNAGYTRGDYYHFHRRQIRRRMGGTPDSGEAPPVEADTDEARPARREFKVESPPAPPPEEGKTHQ
jgi:capsular exopolysaccharide synthesis family protein